MKRRFLVIALILVLFILFALYGSTLYFLGLWDFAGWPKNDLKFSPRMARIFTDFSFSV